jgi:hypothetical protein
MGTEFIVEQALRRSHCAKKGEEHKCVGSCTIRPDGVFLECGVCGKDENPLILRSEEHLVRAITAVFGVTGLDFSSLRIEVQRSALDEFRRALINERAF